MRRVTVCYLPDREDTVRPDTYVKQLEVEDGEEYRHDKNNRGYYQPFTEFIEVHSLTMPEGNLNVKIFNNPRDSP